MRIMLVEDNEGIIMGLEYLLSQEGYQVMTARTMAQALKYLDSMDWDLVLLDIMLPDGDGFALCKRIKREAGAPVIFLTAREEEADGRECSLTVTIAPLSLVIYSYVPYTRRERLEIEKRKAEKEAKEQARLAEEQAAQAREEVLAAQKALEEAREKAALAEELAATSLERARQAEEELKSLKKGR